MHDRGEAQVDVEIFPVGSEGATHELCAVINDDAAGHTNHLINLMADCAVTLRTGSPLGHLVNL